MLSKRVPSWTYHAEQLDDGRWCLRARSSAGTVLRYTNEGAWAEEGDGIVFASWRTRAEALSVYVEPRILADTWAEIDSEAPAWDAAERGDPFAEAFDLQADPNSIIPLNVERPDGVAGRS